MGGIDKLLEYVEGLSAVRLQDKHRKTVRRAQDQALLCGMIKRRKTVSARLQGVDKTRQLILSEKMSAIGL